MRFVQRVANIVVRPRSEWPVVAAEPATPTRLFLAYIAPLAAIGPLLSIIGLSTVSITLPRSIRFQVPLSQAVAHALANYALALIGVYMLARIIHGLAPRFASDPDDLQALKLAAYAATPSWITGVVLVIPSLGVLKLLAAAYGLYLLWLGLPILMKTPGRQAPSYFGAVATAAIAIGLFSTAISNFFLRHPAG